MFLFRFFLLFIQFYLFNCVVFPKDSKKDETDLQALIEKLDKADADKPGFCDNQIDYYSRIAESNPYKPLIYLNWDLDKRKQGNNGAFGKAFESYKGNNPKNVFKTYLEAIYNSGPIQALIKHFSEAEHDFFYDNENKFMHSKEVITNNLVELWEHPKSNSAFKHVFFGEKREKDDNGNSNKNYVGLHSWLGFWLMQVDQKIYMDKTNNKNFDVVSNINAHYKDNPKAASYSKNGHTMLMNKSPAFELALYTTLALYYGSSSSQKGAITSEKIKIDGCEVNFKISYREFSNGGSGKTEKMIQTIFPNEFGSEDGQCRQHYRNKLKTEPCCKKK